MGTPYTPPEGYRLVDIHVEPTPFGTLSHRRVERIDATAPRHLTLMATPSARTRERREVLAGLALVVTEILAVVVVAALYGWIFWSGL